MAVDPVLLFMARIGLGLEQEDVAKAAGIGLRSLQRLEADAAHTTTTLKSLRAVRAALEGYGVRFLGESETHGPGLLFPVGFPENRPRTKEKPLRLRSKIRIIQDKKAKTRVGKSSTPRKRRGGA